MKYQLQGRGVDGLDPALQISRAQGQISDLRSEATELGQTTKALRTEVLDLRSNFTTMGKRLEALQGENAGLRKELHQMADCVGQFNGHLETLAKAVQESTTAVAAAVRALEARKQQSLQQQQDIRQAMELQRQDQAESSLVICKSRQEICQQLDQLGQKESQLQRDAAAAATAQAGAIQKLERGTHEQMTGLCSGMGRLAQQEQDSLVRMSDGFQKVLDCEKNLSESLSAVTEILGNLARQSEQVLVEDRGARLDHLQREAAHFNALGLKCLADGRLEEAIRKFEQARECAPAAFEPAFNLSIAHLRLGHPAVARTLSDELLQAFPDRAELLFLHGVANLAAQDYAAARRHLGRIAESEGRHDAARAAAGLAHLLNGDATSAAAEFQRAAGSGRPEAQMLREAGFQGQAVA